MFVAIQLLVIGIWSYYNNIVKIGVSIYRMHACYKKKTKKTIGAGDVTNLDPSNNTVIAHFEDEGESCDFTCEVKNNGTQTDTVWSFKNGLAESEKIIGGHISGDYRPGSQSHYSNHLQITDCSLRELDGVTVYCGSQNNPKQAFFELKVCGELIWRKTGTVLMSFFYNYNRSTTSDERQSNTSYGRNRKLPNYCCVDKSDS